MTHLRKLLPLLAVLFVTAFFVQCAKDDAGLYDGNAKQFGPQIEQPIEYLQGDKKEEAIKLLQARMAAGGLQSRNEGWTIDFSEVLRVTDSAGTVNFTYRVNHPGVAEDVFYNLVHTETAREFTTVKLVRYHMHPEFAREYYHGERGIEQFAGIITFRPLVQIEEPLPDPVDPPAPLDPDNPPPPPAEPCEEETVIVVPPSSSSGGSGGGFGGGVGTGGGSWTGLYDALAQLPRANCWNWVVKRCAKGEHVGNVPPCVDGYDGNCCEQSFIGSTTLVNYCTRQIIPVYGRNSTDNVPNTTDPCEPVGQIGVLPPVRPQMDAHKKNCDKLKAMSANTNMRAALKDLPTKLGASVEHGYTLKKETGYNSCTPLPPGVGNSIGIPTGLKHYGAFHSHFDGLTPMFSPEDIYVLFRLMQRFSYSGESPDQMVSEFVYTVTTTQGTYALKIDSTDFVSQMYGIMGDAEQKISFYDLGKKQEKTLGTKPPEEHQRIFLDHISKFGLKISLYKANDDLSNWTKLSLDPSNPNNVLNQNCN